MVDTSATRPAARHDVTLNYGPDGVMPDRPTIEVFRGDTIMFHRGPSVTEGTILVTIEDPTAFSRAVFKDGDTDPIEVTQELTQPTPYRCERVVNGKPVSVKGQQGGTIQPGRPGGG